MRVARVALVLVLACYAVASAAPQAKRFASLDDAVNALIGALRSFDRKALGDILGPQGRTLVSSGDDVADHNAAQRFVAEYDKAHRLEGGSGKVVLYVGPDDFPFPIPLVPDGPSWRWDTDAGREEILNRRIGRNELSAIQVCLAYVDAQREYYSQSHTRDGILEYAQRIASSPGKRDGLYWPTKSDESPSPLGPSSRMLRPRDTLAVLAPRAAACPSTAISTASCCGRDRTRWTARTTTWSAGT